MSIDIKWLEEKVLSRKLSAGEQEALQKLEAVTFKRGDSIISKGQPGGTLYILRSGIAQVEDVNEGIRVRIAGLEEGTIFGEMSFLNNQTTTAEVTALQNCEVYTLSKETFSEFMAKEEDLAFSIFCEILNEQTAIVQKMNAQLIPIWRNIKKKAQQLPLIVKLIPVILIVTYMGAWVYQWKTQENKHNYQQEVQMKKQATKEHK